MTVGLVQPQIAKRFRFDVSPDGTHWYPIPGIAGSSGSGGTSTPTPIVTWDENYQEPGDAPPPTITVNIGALDPSLDVFRYLKARKKDGIKFQLRQATKSQVPVQSLVVGRKVAISDYDESDARAGADPYTRGKCTFTEAGGAAPLKWGSSDRLRLGMCIADATPAVAGTNLYAVEEIVSDSVVYVSVAGVGGVGAPAADVPAFDYGVIIPVRRRIFTVGCAEDPIQSDDIPADGGQSGTIQIVPTGDLPDWDRVHGLEAA